MACSDCAKIFRKSCLKDTQQRPLPNNSMFDNRRGSPGVDVWVVLVHQCLEGRLSTVWDGAKCMVGWRPGGPRASCRNSLILVTSRGAIPDDKDKYNIRVLPYLPYSTSLLLYFKQRKAISARFCPRTSLLCGLRSHGDCHTRPVYKNNARPGPLPSAYSQRQQ